MKEPLSVKIQTNLPPSRGLGSSAAVAVAFVRASYDFMDQPLDDKTLIKEANWRSKSHMVSQWYRYANDCVK